MDKYPVILKLLEGEVSQKEITLSAEEQKRFAEYFSLELCQNTYEEWVIYLMAQGDLLEYLKQVMK